VGKPSPSLPFSTTPSGSAGSWLGLSTAAQGAAGKCIQGMGVAAVTGSLVGVAGLTATYSGSTGSRVYSKTSSCGAWTLLSGGPPQPPAPPYSPPPPFTPPTPPLALTDYFLPDARLTPGDTNPDVNESSTDVTICCHYRGSPDCEWSTSWYRPPTSYTTGLKIAQLAGSYSRLVPIWGDSTGAYEEGYVRSHPAILSISLACRRTT